MLKNISIPLHLPCNQIGVSGANEGIKSLLLLQSFLCLFFLLKVPVLIFCSVKEMFPMLFLKEGHTKSVIFHENLDSGDYGLLLLSGREDILVYLRSILPWLLNFKIQQNQLLIDI